MSSSGDGISHYAACRDDERNAESQQHQTKNDIADNNAAIIDCCSQESSNSDTGPAHGPAAAYRLIVRGPLLRAPLHCNKENSSKCHGWWQLIMNQSVHTLKVTSIHKIVKSLTSRSAAPCVVMPAVCLRSHRDHTRIVPIILQYSDIRWP